MSSNASAADDREHARPYHTVWSIKAPLVETCSLFARKFKPSAASQQVSGFFTQCDMLGYAPWCA